jgi:hypothetical protein
MSFGGKRGRELKRNRRLWLLRCELKEQQAVGTNNGCGAPEFKPEGSLGF